MLALYLWMALVALKMAMAVCDSAGDLYDVAGDGSVLGPGTTLPGELS